MPSSTSVVTPERYAQGRTFAEYLAYIGSADNLARPAPGGGARQDNSERFQRNIDEFTLTPAETAALQALPARRMLVIGEDWCPDVYRGMPVLARICEVAGWEMRIFQRDDHPDLIAEFLLRRDGEAFQSIPVAALYTPEGRLLGSFHERPQVAYIYMNGLQKRFSREPGESEDEMRTRIRQAYRDLQQSNEWDQWRHATVEEIIAIAKTAA